MKRITNRQLNSKVSAEDIWLSETLIWGHGSLVARLAKNGEQRFYFRYVNSHNKRVQLPLGLYCSSGSNGMLTLANARGNAYELAQLHASGIKDVKEHLQQINQPEQQKTELNSVENLYKHWLAIDLVHRKDQGSEVERIFEKDVLPLIASKNVEDVSKKDITYITDQILLRGSDRMANVVFSLLRQMFLFGVDRDWIAVDPTASIRKSKIGSRGKIRERTLSNRELVEFKNKLDKSSLIYTSKIALLICLSTCCRIGEITQSSWSSVNFKTRIWTIQDTKNGQPLQVYLSDFTLKLFTHLHHATSWSSWCIPNRHNSGPINSKTISKQVGDRQRPTAKDPLLGRSKEVDSLKLSGGHWTPHDLRRTAATMMVANGVLPEVADRCLNHLEENRIKRTYLRHDYHLEMKEAWETLGNSLSEHITL